MFRDRYKRLNGQVTPDQGLVNATIQAAQTQQSKQNAPLFGLRKPALAAAALCLCVFLGVPALAATVDPVYQIMYAVSPSVAQFFMPVQKSDEDNGIKMEVVSAYIHDQIAEIYITMQDLTGDRIDSTTDLYDSYSIQRPFDSSGYCQLVEYDEDTKTVTFLITINEWGNQSIVGDKITFSVGQFLSHKNIYEDLLIPIDLGAVSAAQNTQTVFPNGWGGVDMTEFEDSLTALTPDNTMGAFPVDGITLTGLGYIDGKLHIQTSVADPLSCDNHGYFYLKDSQGNVVDCGYNFSFSNQQQSSDRIDYSNYVFDIPRDELPSYTLYGYFVTSGMSTEGNWRVTFPLESPQS